MRRTVRRQRRRDRQSADYRRLLRTFFGRPGSPVDSLTLFFSLITVPLALLPLRILRPLLFQALLPAARVIGFGWWPTTSRTAHVEQSGFFNRNEFNRAESVLGEIGRQSLGLIPVIEIDIVVIG